LDLKFVSLFGIGVQRFCPEISRCGAA